MCVYMCREKERVIERESHVDKETDRQNKMTYSISLCELTEDKSIVLKCYQY